jgi:hypothetical protein
VAVTPDSQQAVSASNDGMLKVWDLKTGRVLCTLEFVAGLARPGKRIQAQASRGGRGK